MLDKDILAIASGLYSPLFATQETIGDAYNYAQQIARGTDNPAAIMTAVHVLMNTIAHHLEDTVRTRHHADAEAFIKWAQDRDNYHNQESREG